MRATDPNRPRTAVLDAWPVPATIFVLALALRVAHVFALQRHDPFFDLPSVDARMYHEWALAILGGQWLSDDVFLNGPLYPYLLALVYAGFGPGLLAAKLAQAVAGAVACVLVWALAKRLFDARVALLAAGLTVFGEMLLFYGGTLVVANLLVPLSLGAVWASVAAFDRPTAGRFALAGLLTGLGVIARPNLLLYAAIVLLWMPLALRGGARGWRTVATAAAAFSAGVALCVLPVTAHNRWVGDDWVLVTNAGGMNLYLGNNPDANGTFRVPRFFPRSAVDDPWEQRAAFTGIAERTTGETLRPSEVSRFWSARALEWIADHPRAWLALTAHKVSIVFNAWEPWNIRSIELSRELSWVLRLPLVSFALLAPFALAGLCWSASQWRRLVPLYALLAAVFGTMVVFFALSRYRLPALPLLAIFASTGVVGLVDRLREQRWRALAPVVAASAAFALFTQRDVGRDDLSIAYYNLANRYAQRGELDLAIRNYWEAVRRRPDYIPSYNNLAVAYERNGQVNAAAHVWREVQRIAESRNQPKYLERAERHLEALGVDPDTPPEAAAEAPAGAE